jgi:hypothetical protein
MYLYEEFRENTNVGWLFSETVHKSLVDHELRDNSKLVESCLDICFNLLVTKSNFVLVTDSLIILI